MREKNLMLLRHPETEANVKGLWTGRGNTPFTDLGLLQIELLAEEIVRFAPDSIFSSPLERTVTVAKRAAAAIGIPAHVDERFTELDFGAAEGLTIEEAHAIGIDFDFRSQDTPVAPGGESRRDILVRTAAAIDEVLDVGDRVAIVTHGGVFRAALVHVLRLPTEAIWAFHIRNGQVAELQLADGWARLEEFRCV